MYGFPPERLQLVLFYLEASLNVVFYVCFVFFFLTEKKIQSTHVCFVLDSLLYVMMVTFYLGVTGKTIKVMVTHSST